MSLVSSFAPLFLENIRKAGALHRDYRIIKYSNTLYTEIKNNWTLTLRSRSDREICYHKQAGLATQVGDGLIIKDTALLLGKIQQWKHKRRKVGTHRHCASIGISQSAHPGFSSCANPWTSLAPVWLQTHVHNCLHLMPKTCRRKKMETNRSKEAACMDRVSMKNWGVAWPIPLVLQVWLQSVPLKSMSNL